MIRLFQTAILFTAGLYPIGSKISLRHGFTVWAEGLAGLLVLLALPQVLFAATTDSGWDCHQDQENGEWICTTDQARQAKVEQPKGELPTRPRLSGETGPTETVTDPFSGQHLTPALTHDRPRELKEPADMSDPLFQEDALEEGPPTIARQPGWTCNSSGNDSGWDCHLFGPDPAGQAHSVGETEESLVGNPSFSNEQEMIFRDMISRIPYDPWDQCTTRRGSPRPPRVSTATRELSPSDINADYVDVYNRQIMSLSGNVDYTRLDQRTTADEAEYDTEAEVLNARGNVHYNDQDQAVYADRAFIRMAEDKAKLRNSLFIDKTGPGRGRAKLTDKISKSVTHFYDAIYTTCAPGNQDWTLGADFLEIDRNEGLARATNAWVNISGVPVLYTPFMEFPIDNRRKSGFLNPIYQQTRTTGFDLSLPFYWNIAPNYDADIVPRYMGKRGLLLFGRFRYLTDSSNGIVEGAIIPQDFKKDKKSRGAFSLVNQTQITESLASNTNFNWVSDLDYFNDFRNLTGSTTFSYIRGFSDLTYNNDEGFNAKAMLDYYQSVDPDSPDTPYRRLPQILVSYNSMASANTTSLDPEANDWLYGFRGEYVHFQKQTGVTTHRLDLKQAVSWPLSTAGISVTPKLALTTTQYLLQNQSTGTPSSITRILPLFSIESELVLERYFTLGQSSMVQTLEPKLYYLFVPEKNQDDIPLFDTGGFDSSMAQLSRDNRFNSTDRIGDANQLSMTLTSRFLESATGIERLIGTVGMTTYFKDRVVQLSPDTPPETKTFSNVVGNLQGLITENLRFQSELQWNPYHKPWNDRGSLDRLNASLVYGDEENRILNLNYRYRKDNLEQVDVSARWPLFNGWTGVGRGQYSLKAIDHEPLPARQLLSGFLGVEKEACCWRVRLLGRWWRQNNEINRGLFVQLELKGFSSFGDKLDQFLVQNLPGYRPPEDAADLIRMPHSGSPSIQ